RRDFMRVDRPAARMIADRLMLPANGKRYPAWIRTRTKRTKISCATVTLPGSGVVYASVCVVLLNDRRRCLSRCVRGTAHPREARTGSNREDPMRFAYLSDPQRPDLSAN